MTNVTRSFRVPRAIVVLALALLAVPFVVPGAVVAHSDYQSSVPKNKAVLDEAPTRIEATFSQPMKSAGSSLRLQTSGGKAVASGGLAASDSTAKTMTIEDLPPLAPGRYVVLWKNVARDGDAATGSFGFTVNAPAATPTPAPTELPPASATPAPAQTSPPPASEPPSASATAAAPTAVPTPQPADPAGSSGGDVLLPAIGVLVLILGLGLGLVMRRRSA